MRDIKTVSPPEIGMLVYNDNNQWVVCISNFREISWTALVALYRVVPVSRSSHPSIRRGSNSKCHKLFHNKNRLNGAGVWYCLERRLGGYITVVGGSSGQNNLKIK